MRLLLLLTPLLLATLECRSKLVLFLAENSGGGAEPEGHKVVGLLG